MPNRNSLCPSYLLPILLSSPSVLIRFYFSLKYPGQTGEIANLNGLVPWNSLGSLINFELVGSFSPQGLVQRTRPDPAMIKDDGKVLHHCKWWNELVRSVVLQFYFSV